MHPSVYDADPREGGGLWGMPVAPFARRPVLTDRLFMKMGHVEDDQSGQIESPARGNHLAAKSSLVEERNAPGVVEMGVGEEDKIDGSRLETEGLGVLVLKLAASLKHAAIDQDALAGAFNEVTGTGDVSGCAVEAEFHAISAPVFKRESPFISYQRTMLCHASSA